MSVRDTIRLKAQPRIDYVDLDGEKVCVRALSGKGRAEYMQMVEKQKENGGVKVEVIAAMAICEPDGTLAYDPNNDADVAELASKDGGFLSKVALKLFDISGLTEKSIEEEEKN